MAIITSPVETQKIMGIEKANPGRRSHALSRCYGGACPLYEGEKVTLAFEARESGRRVMKQYGTATVRSILEMPFNMRCKDTATTNRLAVGEGFTNARGWGMYYGTDVMPASTVFHRLQFDNIELATDGSFAAARVAKHASQPKQAGRKLKAGEVKTVGSVDGESLESFDRAMFGGG